MDHFDGHNLKGTKESKNSYVKEVVKPRLLDRCLISIRHLVITLVITVFIAAIFVGYQLMSIFTSSPSIIVSSPSQSLTPTALSSASVATSTSQEYSTGTTPTPLPDCTKNPPIESDPNTTSPADWCTNRGMAAVAQGRYSEGVTYLERALAVGAVPDGFFYLWLGDAYAGITNYSRAIELYREALISINEKGPRQYILNHLGDAYRAQKDYSQAKNIYQEARDLMPEDSAQALVGLGHVEYEQGNYQGAVDFYSQAIDIVPSGGDALFYINRGDALFASGDNDAALADYTVAISESTVLEWTTLGYMRRGDLLYSLSRTDEAIENYLKAREHSPSDAEIYNRIGEVYWNNMHQNLAIENYNVAIALNPLYAEAYVNRAEAVDLLDTQQSLADLQKAIELTDDPKLEERAMTLQQSIQGRLQNTVVP